MRAIRRTAQSQTRVCPSGVSMMLPCALMLVPQMMPQSRARSFHSYCLLMPARSRFDALFRPSSVQMLGSS